MRLAIITTHPIQYNAPFFRLLAQHPLFTIKVFYTWGQLEHGDKYDPGFGKTIKWDIPLLDGYEYVFVKNTSPQPGTHHYKGIINPTLNAEVESWKPDAVLVYGWSFKSHLASIRYFHKKIPVLFRGDSTLIDEKHGIKKYIRRLFLKWVYRHIDFALYTGTHNQAYFTAHGCGKEKLVYCPHAIDNNRFSNNEAEYTLQAKNKRDALGFTDEDVVLLFAGKLEPKKNPFFLLRLAKAISNSRFKILFVGNGSLEAELKQAAANDARIQFMDFCNQSVMPVIYRMADIFILPSTGPGETWGLAANEAMACGLAVMLSDKTGGAVDLVDADNGLVFNPANSNACVDFINKLLNSPATLQRMQAASAEKIKNFSYQHGIAALEKIRTLVEKNS
jgi:glycosyltransferase involved in cell wall biosynthesis